MAKIKTIIAREILDSRGVPTIEGKLVTDNGIKVYSQIPSGTSTGSHEGLELRDNDPSRYSGKGVLKAISYINTLIGPKLIGTDVLRQREIDAWLKKADGTKQYEKLGVNTLSIISQLILKAGAVESDIALHIYINKIFKDISGLNIPITYMPTPIYNMINGGKHGTKNIDFQEYHVIPSTSSDFSVMLEKIVSMYDQLRRLFYQRDADVSVSEEGGFTPNLFTNTEAFEMLKEVLLYMKVRLGSDVFTGADCASSYYYKDKKYVIKDKQSPVSSEEYIDFMIELVNNYNILVLEDPVHEEDFVAWQKLTNFLDKQAYIAADDLVAGDIERLKKAYEKQACNAVVLKFNQVATISEMLEFVSEVKRIKWKLIMSHRMGETCDSLIADISVGVQADFVKFGSPARGERIAKYNRLSNIEQKIKESA